MSSIHALPASGEVFLDARNEGRAMRVSWHQDGDLAVLSIWRAGQCIATCRLGRGEILDLVDALVRGLADEKAS